MASPTFVHIYPVTGWNPRIKALNLISIHVTCAKCKWNYGKQPNQLIGNSKQDNSILSFMMLISKRKCYILTFLESFSQCFTSIPYQDPIQGTLLMDCTTEKTPKVYPPTVYRKFRYQLYRNLIVPDDHQALPISNRYISQ